MSYILEALRKSQQERELGRVPTLESPGLFEDAPPAPRRPLWPVAAVGLAAAALGVALFAVLRGPASPDPRAGESVSPEVALDVSAVGTPAGQLGAPRMAAVASPPTPPAAPPGAARAAPPDPSRTAEPLPLEDLAHLGVGRPAPPPVAGPPTPAPQASPLVEPPPPKGAGQPFAADAPRGGAQPSGVRWREGGGARSQASAWTGLDSDLEPVGFGDPELGDPELDDELALQRQIEADLAEELGEDWESALPTDPDPPTPIPPDLVEDIEAFKHRVRGTAGPKAEGSGTRVASAAPLPGSAAGAGVDWSGDPTTLRLTREERADLPSFLMTVHVFDADATRRFVLINGRKYREGERTREGLDVERILAEGAVLRHKGSPFFVHR